MNFPFISKEKYDEVVKESKKHEHTCQILANKLKIIQDLCDEHNKGFSYMANNRFVSIVKSIVGK
tara:strand:- start:477 stop:671 length:195 start_codon:yes stop_codon:yes gene_type:complete